MQNKALIVKFGQIGDVIMALPAVRLLYEQNFRIDWVCGETVKPLLECYSWINVITVNDKLLFRGNIWEKITEIFILWRRIAFRNYDISATLYYDRRYSLLTFPIWAQRKFMLSRNTRSRLILPGRHHTDELARLLLNKLDTCQNHSIAPVRPDNLPVSRLATKTALKRIAIVPGGASNIIRQQTLRRWPIENYVELARRLVERGWEVVLLGGPEDIDLRVNFKNISVTNCINSLSLPEVVSACDTCDAVISHDTGPLHLAGLSTACVVGIFGPTDPSIFLPRRPKVLSVWGGQGFACRPCYDGTDFAPCLYNGCMHEATVGMVMSNLDHLLDS